MLSTVAAVVLVLAVGLAIASVVLVVFRRPLDYGEPSTEGAASAEGGGRVSAAGRERGGGRREGRRPRHAQPQGDAAHGRARRHFADNSRTSRGRRISAAAGRRAHSASSASAPAGRPGRQLVDDVRLRQGRAIGAQRPGAARVPARLAQARCARRRGRAGWRAGHLPSGGAPPACANGTAPRVTWAAACNCSSIPRSSTEAGARGTSVRARRNRRRPSSRRARDDRRLPVAPAAAS